MTIDATITLTGEQVASWWKAQDEAEEAARKKLEADIAGCEKAVALKRLEARATELLTSWQRADADLRQAKGGYRAAAMRSDEALSESDRAMAQASDREHRARTAFKTVFHREPEEVVVAGGFRLHLLQPVEFARDDLRRYVNWQWRDFEDAAQARREEAAGALRARVVANLAKHLFETPEEAA
jgi:hypothetical protein